MGSLHLPGGGCKLGLCKVMKPKAIALIIHLFRLLLDKLWRCWFINITEVIMSERYEPLYYAIIKEKRYIC